MNYARKTRQSPGPSKENEELIELDRAIKAFYTGNMSVEDFIQKHWQDCWGSLISYVEQSGFNMRNGKISQKLLDKKEEFEQQLVKYYLNNPIGGIRSGNIYFEEIAKEDIETCILYLTKTNQLSNKSIKSTIHQYIKGEIPEIQKEPVSKGVKIETLYNKVIGEYTSYASYKSRKYNEKNIKNYYKGLSSATFVEKYSGSWDNLIDSLISMEIIKSRDAVPEAFLARKEEFEQAVIQFFGEEYCKTTQIEVDGQYVHPTTDDISKTIEFLQQNGMEISKKSIAQTLRKYLKGEIEVQHDSEELGELPRERLDTDIQQTDTPHEFKGSMEEVSKEQLDKTTSKTGISQEDSIDLRPMRVQRSKCQALEARLQQVQEELSSKKARLQELQSSLSQPDMEMTRIREFATEILQISQQIEATQKLIDETDVERLAGEQQLKDMKAVAINEIENI